MRRFIVIAVAVAGFAAAPEVAAAKAERSCLRDGDRVVAASDVAVVVTRQRDGSPYYWGCARPTVRRFRLGAYVDFEGGVTQISLAGRFVGYEDSSCGRPAPCVGAVYLRDLRSGRRLRARIPDGGSIAEGVVTNRRGAVAWIRQPDYYGPDREVRVLDVNGERVLERGPAIETFSLAGSQDAWYWLNDGQPRTAPLR